VAEKIFEHVGARDIRISRIEEHRVKELGKADCPGCGAGPMDAVMGMEFKDIMPPGFDNDDDEEENTGPILPKDGTPTVCGYCGELCVFRERDGVMTIEFPSPAEIKEWKLNPGIWKVLTKAHEFFGQKALEARLRGDMRYAKRSPRRF